MTQPESKHAERVVARFREMLGEECRSHFSDEHFDELALLVESAIDAAVLEAKERVLGRLEDLVRDLKKDAEFFEAG